MRANAFLFYSHDRHSIAVLVVVVGVNSFSYDVFRGGIFSTVITSYLDYKGVFGQGDKGQTDHTV
jgi:hypothetical protein